MEYSIIKCQSIMRGWLVRKTSIVHIIKRITGAGANTVKERVLWALS